MKIKNVKMVEQHVEKVVLAVCVAAAAYLGYSAFSSTRSPLITMARPVKGPEVAREESNTSVENLVPRFGQNCRSNQQPVDIEEFRRANTSAIANQPLPG